MKPMLLPGIALLASSLGAQDLSEGNGFGKAYIEVGPAYIGGKFVHDMGSPNAPSGVMFFSVSGGFAETVHPVVGPVTLDVTDPAYMVIPLPTDATGNIHLEFTLPPDPGLVSFPSFYSNAATFEGGGWSLSKTVPLHWENANSWTPTDPMSTRRLHHTATYLGSDGRDNRTKVLVAGGGQGSMLFPTATKTTEVFDPLDRSFSPGPSMLMDRAVHTATRLDDGRVLVTGGMNSNGTCHSSCEIYDHTLGVFSSTGGMTTPRAGHAATLLSDGRVLVTGGFANYEGGLLLWEASLDSSQRTGEVYDPATGSWTAVNDQMAQNRAGHTSTLLNDGSVLLLGGISGGVHSGYNVVPSFTSTADLYQPAGDLFQSKASFFLGRAFHSANVMGDGNVLLAGGVYTGGPWSEAISTDNCSIFHPSLNVWTAAASLSNPTAWHSGISLDDGSVFLSGGMNSTGASLQPWDYSWNHQGSAITPATAIGINVGLPLNPAQPQGGHTLTELHDGSFLVLGGTRGNSTNDTLRSGFVYTPKP